MQFVDSKGEIIKEGDIIQNKVSDGMIRRNSLFVVVAIGLEPYSKKDTIIIKAMREPYYVAALYQSEINKGEFVK